MTHGRNGSESNVTGDVDDDLMEKLCCSSDSNDTDVRSSNDVLEVLDLEFPRTLDAHWRLVESNPPIM